MILIAWCLGAVAQGTKGPEGTRRKWFQVRDRVNRSQRSLGVHILKLSETRNRLSDWKELECCDRLRLEFVFRYADHDNSETVAAFGIEGPRVPSVCLAAYD